MCDYSRVQLGKRRIARLAYLLPANRDIRHAPDGERTHARASRVCALRYAQSLDVRDVRPPAFRVEKTEVEIDTRIGIAREEYAGKVHVGAHELRVALARYPQAIRILKGQQDESPLCLSTGFDQQVPALDIQTSLDSWPKLSG